MAFALTTVNWNSGQGVTVIIEHNVTDTGLTTAATWVNGIVDAGFYNATPQILPNRSTMVYVVGYNDSAVPGAAPTRYYITSQTFGRLQ